MSLGFGVFLGLFFVGLVILYTKNRDVVSMKKILKWLGIIFGSLVVLFVLIYLGFYMKDRYDSRPQIISELRNVKLGESIQDTKFRVGELKKDKKSTDANSGYVLPSDGYYDFTNDKYSTVKIINDKVASIEYFCESENYFLPINGISCGTRGDVILEKFGKDVEVFCLINPEVEYDKDLVRAYAVKKYQIRYFLGQNEVVGFKVAKPDDLVSNKNWKECK